jgi:hypothetical protein
MQRRPRTGRPQGGRGRPNGRASVRTTVGIAASALVLGGAAAVIVAAGHGSTPSAAQSAAFSSGFGSSGMSEWNLLSSAVSNWGSSTRTSMTKLASVSQQTFGQTTEHDQTLDVQRGIVVFASRQFLILQSKNGSLHLWLLGHHTHFENVSNSTSGTEAMTASTSVSQQAVMDGDMNPLVDWLAGGTRAAEKMLTPASQSQSVSVPVPGTDLSVTVTITKSMAKVSQTGTMPASGWSVSDPSTMTENAWTTAGTKTHLARGDVAMVVGTRSDGMLRAEIVLYTPLSTGDMGGMPTASPSASPSASPTATPSPSVSPSPSSTASLDW